MIVILIAFFARRRKGRYTKVLEVWCHWFLPRGGGGYLG